MQISLQEDDSMFHGGTPQLVVLVVKFDNGNTKRIPYEACKTIASLYQDLYAIAPQVVEAPQMNLVDSIEEVVPMPEPIVVCSQVVEHHAIGVHAHGQIDVWEWGQLHPRVQPGLRGHRQAEDRVLRCPHVIHEQLHRRHHEQA